MPESKEKRPRLSEALDHVRAKSPFPRPDRPEYPILPKPGELRTARSLENDEGSARLVLVLSVDHSEGVVSAALTSNELALATELDVRLPAAETDLSFPITVEADVVGPLWFIQLGPSIGLLRSNLVESISDLQSTISEAGVDERLDEETVPKFLDEYRGLPTRSDRDPRWLWKRSEAAEMHRLSRECLEALVQGETRPSVVDPNPKSVNEQIEFRLFRMPCCGHLLCWVNPRLPSFCPQCGETIFSRLRFEKDHTLVHDKDASIRYSGTL